MCYCSVSAALRQGIRSEAIISHRVQRLKNKHTYQTRDSKTKAARRSTGLLVQKEEDEKTDLARCESILAPSGCSKPSGDGNLVLVCPADFSAERKGFRFNPVRRFP
jgi:hypothetical protein